MSKANILAQLASWLTPDSSGNIVHGAPPSQFDNSGKLATTGFIAQRGPAFRSQVVVSTATTLTAATHAGCEVTVNAGVNVTLPLASTCPTGTIIAIFSLASGAGILRQGSDVLSMTPSSTNAAMGANDSLILMSDGTGVWLAIGGSLRLAATASFASQIGTYGYQKLPSGVILQWGVGQAGASGSSVTNNFPLAFPNAPLAVTAMHNGSDGTVNIILDSAIGLTSKTQFGLRSSYASGNVYVNYQAIGY